MTIDHVLYYLEWLKIDKERKYEAYMRIHSRATSPQCALGHDGMPHASDPHARERLLTECGDALNAYYDAVDSYWNYKALLEKNIDKLDYKYRIALYYKYIWNLDRGREYRINGIARSLSIKRVEVPAIVDEAKAKLADHLRAHGAKIE